MSLDWKDIGKKIADFAPALGAAVGGPGGGAIGALIAATLGTSSDPTEIGQALTQDREAIYKLKTLENEHYAEISSLLIEQGKQDVLNLQSAREMQIEALKSKDRFARRFVYYLAGFWSIMACLYIGLITFVGPAPGSERYADTAMGFLLGTVISAIIQFFLGSSAGSKTKDALIAGLERRK